jgi:hypothetical protein
MAKTDEERMVQRSVALPPALWARVEAYAAKISAVKISHSAAIRDALTRYFDTIELPSQGEVSGTGKTSAKPTAKKGAKAR